MKFQTGAVVPHTICFQQSTCPGLRLSEVVEAVQASSSSTRSEAYEATFGKQVDTKRLSSFCVLAACQDGLSKPREACNSCGREVTFLRPDNFGSCNICVSVTLEVLALKAQVSDLQEQA